MLNGYFEEWCALTESSANEAFNVQDGLNFTWVRFWELLAKWYGTGWEPPSQDESKYRTQKTRHQECPRGVSLSAYNQQILTDGSTASG